VNWKGVFKRSPVGGPRGHRRAGFSGCGKGLVRPGMARHRLAPVGLPQFFLGQCGRVPGAGGRPSGTGGSPRARGRWGAPAGNGGGCWARGVQWLDLIRASCAGGIPCGCGKKSPPGRGRKSFPAPAADGGMVRPPTCRAIGPGTWPPSIRFPRPPRSTGYADTPNACRRWDSAPSDDQAAPLGRAGKTRCMPVIHVGRGRQGDGSPFQAGPIAIS